MVVWWRKRKAWHIRCWHIPRKVQMSGKSEPGPFLWFQGFRGKPPNLYDELGQVASNFFFYKLSIKIMSKILKNYIQFNFSVSFQFFRMSPHREQLSLLWDQGLYWNLVFCPVNWVNKFSQALFPMWQYVFRTSPTTASQLACAKCWGPLFSSAKYLTRHSLKYNSV